MLYVGEPDMVFHDRSRVVPLVAVAVKVGGEANVVMACAVDVVLPYAFVAITRY